MQHTQKTRQSTVGESHKTLGGLKDQPIDKLLSLSRRSFSAKLFVLTALRATKRRCDGKNGTGYPRSARIVFSVSVILEESRTN